MPSSIVHTAARDSILQDEHVLTGRSSRKPISLQQFQSKPLVQTWLRCKALLATRLWGERFLVDLSYNRIKASELSGLVNLLD